MDEKILFVDDDPNVLAATERSFRRRFTVETAAGGEQGLEKIVQQGPFDVVVSDRQMPKMDGIQFLRLVRERAPETVRIMLTGNADLEVAIQVVNEGNIFRFLTKPCALETLTKALEDAVAQYRLVMAEKELLTKTLNGAIKLLTDILSMMELESFGRTQTMREVVAGVTKAFKLDSDWEIQLAAMLAPIGYVTIPTETLQRAHAGERLSEAEEKMLAEAPETAARLLANIPRLEGVAQLVRYQQKHFDGRGSPANDIKGDAIPFGGRLLKILADMNRLLSGGATRTMALNEMECRPGWYDPALLEAVRSHFGVAPAEPRMARPPVSLGFRDLKPGMVLRSNLETVSGILILSRGHQLSEMTLEKLANFKRMGGVKEPIIVEAPEPMARAV